MEAGSVEGIIALSNEISKRDVRIRELEISMRTCREEAERLRTVVKEKDDQIFLSQAVADFYREFYVLSKAKLRRFVMMVKDLEGRSFLFTFIRNCLPDNTPNEVKLELDEMMMLPTSEEPTVVTNNYNAPIAQQINAGEVRLQETQESHG